MHESMCAVPVTYHLFYLIDFQDETVPAPKDLEESNGLICPLRSGAVVITGTDTGKVTVSVDLHDAEPELSMDGWDEGADVSVHAPHGKLNVDAVGYEFPGLPELSTQGPGWYRIRCLARNRLAELNSIGSDPRSEEYLIVCWPAPPAPERVHAIQWHISGRPYAGS
ncbi:hypothetical protein LFT44_08285 [Arthrobacter sp. FW306-05-C]|uniref:hypothetical protein n=1 Tax=Arthrobacter sp. FW306-05-C TaxID=2879620 RepID=UPI001F2713B3|nr:hypothetical protein [Arthrobacter sp. FW306-05-C]UKA68370.1 hypothetical protein LFT44_08285 [Arthrobacter sp. FW306-05-C]